MGSLGRRPGPTSSRAGAEAASRGEEWPGIEALRRNQVTRRPKRVVEASVGVNDQARRVLLASCRHGTGEAGDHDPCNPVSTETTLS